MRPERAPRAGMGIAGGRPDRESKPTVASRLAIKVRPRACRNAVTGGAGDEWKVSVTAAAVDGKANQACIDFLARSLGVPRQAISIVRGERSRHKLIEVAGLTQEALEHLFRERFEGASEVSGVKRHE